MLVKELIYLLSKSPEDNIILVDVESITLDGEITDVLIGTGTLKSFSFIKIEPCEE